MRGTLLTLRGDGDTSKIACMADIVQATRALPRSSATMPAASMREAMAAAAKHLGFQLPPASLIGLSAGGFGVCRLYADDSRGYSRLICMAAFPPTETLGRFKKDSSLFFVAGGSELFVESGQLGRSVQSIRRNAPSAEMKSIPGAGHFFMLTHPQPTRDILKSWIGPVR